MREVCGHSAENSRKFPDPPTLAFSKKKHPDPPTLAFFDFLAFFVFRLSLLFWGIFLSFPRILGVPRREEPLAFLGESPCAFFFPKKQGLEGQGKGNPEKSKGLSLRGSPKIFGKQSG